jgi:dienelactone hydrolase
MKYDPFARGPLPVGVRTIQLPTDSFVLRPVPVDIWYPATEAFRGKDLNDATRDPIRVPGLPDTTQSAVRDADAVPGTYPLILYSHGGYGHRQECTHLCTHLASYGFVVAAPNFPGDNLADLLPGPDGSEAVVAKTPIDESAARRPKQASSFLGQLLSMSPVPGVTLDAQRIGTTGISMGGYTSLALNSVDRRPSASFAMCPMFGEHSLLAAVKRLQSLLHVDDWGRPVQTCVLSGAVDPLVNARDMRVLYERLSTPKRLVVVEKAGHMHWADRAEFGHEFYRNYYLSGTFPDPDIDAIALGTAMLPISELCTEQQTGDVVRGLCLAHMDAHLNGDAHAHEFLEGDIAAVFAPRGVTLEVKSETSTLTV